MTGGRGRASLSRGRRERSPVLTGADRLVLYVLVGVGLALLLVPRGGGAPAAALVEGADGYRSVVPLAAKRTLEVKGPLGTTTVAVGNGSARVVRSPCPHRVCVAAGAMSRPGEVAVCVPNGVVVRILGEGEPELDATTR